MNAVADPPVSEGPQRPAGDDRPAPQEEAASLTTPKDGNQPTRYVVVAVIHPFMEPANDTPEHPSRVALKNHVPGVPFIVGNDIRQPELFESRGGGDGAKRACLEAHPALAACVREPGLSLATWPERSYGFKAIEFEARPDKLVV